MSTFDCSDDLARADQGETVQFTHVLPAGRTTLSLVNCLRGAVSREAAQLLGDIGLEPDDCTWNLPSKQLGAITPLAGDELTAGGDTWIVLAAQLLTLGTRWRIVARRLR